MCLPQPRGSPIPGSLSRLQAVNDALWMALGLFLVLEGLMPALNPAGWRKMFEQILKLEDAQLRSVGLFSMCLGLLILWLMTT